MNEPFGTIASHLQDCCGGCPYCVELCQQVVDEANGRGDGAAMGAEGSAPDSSGFYNPPLRNERPESSLSSPPPEKDDLSAHTIPEATGLRIEPAEDRTATEIRNG